MATAAPAVTEALVEEPAGEEDTVFAQPMPDGLNMLMKQAAEAGAAGDEERLVAFLEQAIVAYPAAPQPRIVLGRYYMLKRDSASALEILEEFVWGAEPTPALLGLYGAAQISEGKYSEARDSLESLRELQPGNPAVHYQLAKVYAQLGETDLIESSLQKAIELNPQSVESQIALARFYLLRGDMAAAEAVVDAARSLAPDNPDVLKLVDSYEQQLAQGGERNDIAPAMLRAQERLASGDMEGAIGGYQEVLELDPNNIEALNNLAWFSKESDPEGALAYARKAASLAPDSAMVLDTLAMVLVENQQIDEAVKTIESALAIAPGESGIQLHSAIILQRAGNSQRALQTLQQLAASEDESLEKQQAQALLEAWEREAADQG